MSLKGILSVHDGNVSVFRWTDIANLIHHKKLYTIELNDGNRKNYLMVDGDLARLTWRVSVKQHQYFLKSNPKSNDQIDSSPNIVDSNDNPQLIHQILPPDVYAYSHSAEQNGSTAHFEDIHRHPEQHPRTSVIHIEPVQPNAVPTIPNQLVPDAQRQYDVLSGGETMSAFIPTIPVNGTLTSSPYSNVTTVQVHHEPQWVSSFVNHNEPEHASLMERKAHLPPYREPPTYEEFMRDKRSFQNVAINNVTYHSNVIPNFSELKELVYTSPQTTIVPQYYLANTKRPFTAPSMQPFTEISARPRLSLPQSNGLYVHAANYTPASNPFTNSSPDLHSFAFGVRTLQPQTQTVFKQSLPYTSVPDLSGQPRSLDQKYFIANQRTNPPQQPIYANEIATKFPGSEPSIPNANYNVLYAHAVSQAPHFRTASRHLSIDTLNSVKQQVNGFHLINIGDQYHGRDYLLKRPLNGFTIRESARESQLMPPMQPSHRNEPNGVLARRRSHEENVYENIQELRASLQNEMQQETELLKAAEAEVPVVNGQPEKKPDVASPVSPQPESTPKVEPPSPEKEVSKLETSLDVANTSAASVISKDPRVVALESKLDDADFMRDFELLPRMNPAAKFTTGRLTLETVIGYIRVSLQHSCPRIFRAIASATFCRTKRTVFVCHLQRRTAQATSMRRTW